ncbi:3-hydroxybutyryl-CoA dehydrogenase [Cryobacterium flavum]|uniref:3-hydroxyacyl-CoA dehydrogenase family protein n=1 Tax=Cryobacterium flavum TaxID=1424659 RepID=A0A4R8V6V3_9MICO|nr:MULTISPECIES: 3-hydroxyacyl-CoA dehydrogenase family protein [Cryobacterium]TFB78489.1 3-hydroxyacyl-CoA dehydrogenase family protein [Cryobacterium flavum]TFD09842.1 3-hydroxyacyl-CoA dehydrogenase family protein [Cryobacterium sp. TMT1-66-1]TFD12557.1 3-hydroxyacyl-CoA dehydrogenase family protein [Cryobacterium sp. TMT1-2-2]SDM44126.1 3-hydroxybutyryl-CoA dehydrogenase [Cryobacterium flavum]
MSVSELELGDRGESGVPDRVGVLGGGRMGAGIAHAFLLAGAHVALVERDDTEAAAARERVLRAVDASITRGATGETRPELEARLAVGADFGLFSDRELVVEAVPEVRALKVEALQKVEAHLPADAALASNTSSISIDDLADELKRPARFLGLHFFNPVPASNLVELVTGSATSPELVADAQSWVSALGKTPITVSDAPGFASSRLGVALGLEAIRMLEEGVASASDIDAAMMLGYKHPVGPLKLTDLVGLDVRLGIAEYLHQQLGARFEPPALLRKLVAEGKLGRKSGQGFYRWDEA